MPTPPSHVSRFGLTPFKGGAHAHPQTLEVTADGPVGDRLFALVETLGAGELRVVRTVTATTVLRVRSRLDDGVLTLALPGAWEFAVPVAGAPTASLVADHWGRPARIEPLPGPWDAALSSLVGRDVRLARTRPGEVVYGQPITLVTTSSVAELARRARTPTVDDERFRGTVLVDTGHAPAFVEDTWVGRRMRLGGVEVVVRAGIPRCAVTRLEPGTGTRLDDDPMRLLAHDRTVDQEVVFGVGADVVRPGMLVVGDTVATVPR